MRQWAEEVEQYLLEWSYSDDSYTRQEMLQWIIDDPEGLFVQEFKQEAKSILEEENV